MTAPLRSVDLDHFLDHNTVLDHQQLVFSFLFLQDDKLTILAQLFWLAVSLLESDFEHEFLLALRLLSRVLHRLPLDRPDARDKVEKLQAQLRWNNFPGVHALLLKVALLYCLNLSDQISFESFCFEPSAPFFRDAPIQTHMTLS